MVSASPLISQPAPQPVGERRVVLRSLDWQGFQMLRNVLSGDRHTRLTYFREILELTTPLEIHEFSGRLIELFVRILVGELGMDLKTMGSTTLEREDFVRSAEPDNAYYIQNHYLVADRNIDLEKDPPPDLVVEVDITHTDIDKLSLYAGIGAPEFWRYDGDVWRIYQLEKAVYREVESSPTFPRTPKSKLYEFLATARQSEMKAERDLRAWVRSL
ncbi:MAG: Uma2 family endonuclease [Cyanobacteria bacterium P01_F01_bin.33]